MAYLKKQIKFVLIHPETRDKFHKDRFHYLDSWHRSISHIIWSYFSPRVQNIPLRVHRDIYLCSIQVIISIKTLDPSICYNFLLHIFLLLLFSFYSPLQYSAFTVSIVQRPAGWWASHTRSLSKTLRYSDFIFASDPDINSQVNEEPDVLVWSSNSRLSLQGQGRGFKFSTTRQLEGFWGRLFFFLLHLCQHEETRKITPLILSIKIPDSNTRLAFSRSETHRFWWVL